MHGVTAEGMQTVHNNVTPCGGGDIENAKLIKTVHILPTMENALYIQYARHYMNVLIFVLHAID